MNDLQKNAKAIKSYLALPLLITSTLLLIPLLGMQFTDEIAWTAFDFIVMGALLFAFSSLAIVATKKVSDRYSSFVVAAILLTFIYIWIELAVGVFF